MNKREEFEKKLSDAEKTIKELKEVMIDFMKQTFPLEEDEDAWKSYQMSDEEISHYIDKGDLYAQMQKFCSYYNEKDGFVADWTEESQNKYGILISDKKPIIDFVWASNYFTFGLCVGSQERAEQMLKIFGADLEKYY